MKRPIVLILEGGRSVEYEVSLRSSQGIQQALRDSGYPVAVVRIEKNGAWGAVQGDWPTNDRKFLLTVDPTIYESMKDVVVFPMLHGAYGEDGTIQGALELANLPYVGCGVLASALGLHKGKQKELFEKHGLTTTPWISCSRFMWQHNTAVVLQQIEKKFHHGDELFVKPIRTGSSVGVTMVKDWSNLESAIISAFKYHQECIIEKSAYPMREVEVSVLGTTDVQVSVIGEIIPDREFYDYNAKYDNASKTKLVINPADITDDIKEQVKDAARTAFMAIGCSGLARVDFFLQGSTCIINEINTMPGFTSISMFPKLWEASGIRFDMLCMKLVEYAREVWREKQNDRTSL